MLWADHWFYGCSALTHMDGISALWEMAQLRHALNSCSALESIDLRGFKASALANLAYTFGAYAKPRTIPVDMSRALPAKGLTGMETLCGCKEVAGGSRTVHDASKRGYTMMQVDTARAPRYLTAG